MKSVYLDSKYGWSKLVSPLLRVLHKQGCYILQTKEKFGEFRCYWSPPDSMSDDMMQVLQHATDTKMCTDGWHLPLCKSCAEATGRDWEGGIKPTAGWLTTKYKVDNES